MEAHRKTFTCCASALLLAALAGGSPVALAGEDVYRWQDSQGNTILSDRPPPEGIEHEVIEHSPGLAPGSQLEGDAADALAEEGETDVNTESAPAPMPGNAERCEQARANLEALGNDEGTVTVRNADGSARELTPEEIQVQREATRAQVEVYCRPQES